MSWIHWGSFLLGALTSLGLSVVVVIGTVLVIDAVERRRRPVVGLFPKAPRRYTLPQRGVHSRFAALGDDRLVGPDPRWN